MPDKDLEQIKQTVHDLKTLVQETSGDGDDPLLKERVDKIGTELQDMQRKVNDFQYVSPAEMQQETEEEQKAREAQYEKLWSTDKTKAIAQAYGSQKTEAERKLYQPRTTWKHGKGYVRERGYDDLEDIMFKNDCLILMGVLKAYQKTGMGRIDGYAYREAVKSLASYELWKHEIESRSELRKALDTTDGSDFIPTQFSAQLIDDVRLALRVGQLFPRINPPRSPFTSPLLGTRVEAYLVGESTDDDSTKIPTRDPNLKKNTWTAIKFAVRTLFSDEFEEDSIVPVLPLMRTELVQALADAEETAILNGDDSSSHMDSDVTSSNDVKKAYKGLRHYGYDAGSGYAAVDISTFSVATIRSIRQKMGRFGVVPANIPVITSMSAYIQMLSFDEVETVDKFPNATIVNGQLGMLDGMAVIVSEFMRQDLNASGVYDGSTTTKTGILIPYVPSFIPADFGTPRAESDRDIETQQTKVVTSRRTDFQRVHTPSSDEQNVGFGYNITS